MPEKVPKLVTEKVLQVTAHQQADGSETRPFFVADLSKVEDLLHDWRRELPLVTPYYAVKCNPDSGLLEKCASLGMNFDCASKTEIQDLVSLGVDPSRIIYSHPIKSPRSLQYAREIGLEMVVFDNEDELHKIKTCFPAAKLVLRIAVDDSSAGIRLSDKFGASRTTSIKLLQIARDLGLNVVGLSFHVGTPARDSSAFAEAVRNALELSKAAEIQLQILNIGGGLTTSLFSFAAEKLRKEVSLAREEHLGLEIIAEPGRYFARSPFWLACQVIGRHQAANFKSKSSLYLNDGAFGNFMNAVVEREVFQPRAVIRKSQVLPQSGRGEHLYTLWGPTCDSTDCIASSAAFEDVVERGDWLLFGDMGAYTSACRTGFNGFDSKAEVAYV